MHTPNSLGSDDSVRLFPRLVMVTVAAFLAGSAAALLCGSAWAAEPAEDASRVTIGAVAAGGEPVGHVIARQGNRALEQMRHQWKAHPQLAGRVLTIRDVERATTMTADSGERVDRR